MITTKVPLDLAVPQSATSPDTAPTIKRKAQESLLPNANPQKGNKKRAAAETTEVGLVRLRRRQLPIGNSD
jgi:hypothetical protein